METKETDLVQQIRQLKDYVILDKKDYEKLVQNSKSDTNNGSVIESLQSVIAQLKYDLEQSRGMEEYWKKKYDTCLEELKKETTRWWRF